MKVEYIFELCQNLDENENEDYIFKKGVIPEGTTIVHFYDDFDGKLEPGCFPKSVRKITFGERFNRRIQRFVFPNLLEELIFGKYFKQNIQVGLFPPSLNKLTIGCRYLSDLGLYAQNLTDVKIFCQCKFHCLYGKYALKALPTKLITLNLPTTTNYNYGKKEIIDLPSTLTTIYALKEGFKGNLHLLDKYNYDDGKFTLKRASHSIKFWFESGQKHIQSSRFKYSPVKVTLSVVIQKLEFGDYSNWKRLETNQLIPLKRFLIHLPKVLSLYSIMINGGVPKEQVELLLQYEACIICDEQSSFHGHPHTECCKKKLCFTCYYEIKNQNMKCPNCRHPLKLTL